MIGVIRYTLQIKFLHSFGSTDHNKVVNEDDSDEDMVFGLGVILVGLFLSYHMKIIRNSRIEFDLLL